MKITAKSNPWKKNFKAWKNRRFNSWQQQMPPWNNWPKIGETNYAVNLRNNIARNSTKWLFPEPLFWESVPHIKKGTLLQFRANKLLTIFVIPVTKITLFFPWQKSQILSNPKLWSWIIVGASFWKCPCYYYGQKMKKQCGGGELRLSPVLGSN